MRPAFRRGWEGEGKPKSMLWRGPAGAQRPPHGGVYFGLGNERAKPLALQPTGNSAGQALTEKRSGSPTTAPSHGATQTDGVPASRASDKAVARSAAPPSKRARARRSSGKKRGESASGLEQAIRALRSAKRGTERVLNPSRSSSPAPDRHPNGPRLQARSAQANRAGRPKGSASHQSSFLIKFW